MREHREARPKVGRNVAVLMAHLDKRFWISVDLDADVPAKEIRRLVDHSYDVVCAGLTRKQSADLAALRP
jgi:predicted DNA-binding protein (MmcQ/YjbR family)